MNREDRQWYEELEKVIKNQKAQSIFFKSESRAYELDIDYLLDHIAKKHPDIAEKFAANFVDITSMKDCSKQDILSFMARTEKNTICKWKDKFGEEHYFINNGKNLFGNRTNIIAFSSRLDKNDLENLKKTMMKKALEKDIKKIYQKIEKEQQVTIRKSKKSFFDIIEEKHETHLNAYASDFEKNFKTLVCQQGGSANSLQLADSMVSFLDKREIKQLSESLVLMGVKDRTSYEHLLSQWKNEALNPEEVKVERKMSRKREKVNVEIMRR